MSRLWVLAIVLAFMTGCAGEGDKAQWDEFYKDLRGDNMKMRTGGWKDADPDGVYNVP